MNNLDNCNNMRKLAANLVYPCIEKPIKFGHLVVDDDGTILDIVDTGGKLIEEEGLEYHNGVLVPGFIINSTQADMTEKGVRMRFLAGVQVDYIEPNQLSFSSKEPVVNQMFAQQTDGASFDDALANATIGAARALGIDNEYGCFKKGIKPGVVLLYPFDFVNNKMRHDTLPKRLV